MLPVRPNLFLNRQASFFASAQVRSGTVMRSVEHAQFGVSLMLELFLLASLHTSAGWLRRGEMLSR